MSAACSPLVSVVGRASKRFLSNARRSFSRLQDIPQLSSVQIESKFTFERIIGDGAEGVVYYGKHLQNDSNIATKKIKYRTSILRQVLKETKIQASLNHSSIPKVFDVFKDKDYIYIVEEYAHGRELFDILIERKLDENECKLILRQLLDVVNHLHESGIVHGDIKAENIIYDEKNKKIALIDYGSARKVSNSSSKGITGGSLAYMAPELITGGNSTKESDLWAIGVLFYTMIFGYPPFFSDEDYRNNSTLLLNAPFWFLNNSDTEYLREEITKADLANIDTVSPSLATLIRTLLSIDPQNRLTASEYLNHPYLIQEKEQD